MVTFGDGQVNILTNFHARLLDDVEGAVKLAFFDMSSTLGFSLLGGRNEAKLEVEIDAFWRKGKGNDAGEFARANGGLACPDRRTKPCLRQAESPEREYA